MSKWSKKFINNKNKDNNRINVAAAIIFLLGLSVIVKIFVLQVNDYKIFKNKAANQHESFGIIESERGKIFIHDDDGNNGKMYPIATNKEFALIYAIPKDIARPDVKAEKFYEIFDRKTVEEEVEKYMKNINEERLKNELDYINNLNLSEAEKKLKGEEAKKIHQALISDASYLEINNKKRIQEIESRKKKIIGDYLNIFNKKDDPYEPMKNKVDEETLKSLFVLLSEDQANKEDMELKGNSIILNKGGNKKEIKIGGISFIMKKYRYYPENNIGSHILGYVGANDNEKNGKYGLEGYFNKELSGISGSVKSERGAGGDLIIVNNRVYNKPQNGSDIILTINRSIQFNACQKLNEAVLRHGADGGSVIVMDPDTGAIIAMCSSPDFDPNNYEKTDKIETYNNQAIFMPYEPGSIFKALTMAAALNEEKVTPDLTFNDTGSIKIAGYEIKNSDKKAHGTVNMTKVLEESLNVGAVFAMRKIGPELFSQYVDNFGFGEKTGIELDTERTGDIKNLSIKKNRDLYAATASFGQGITVTPLQMVSAFGAIANGGILMKPYIVDEIINADGTKIKSQPKQIRRVISQRASLLLGGMLVNVVENGHGKKAGVKGYYVGGKTGTAQIPRKDKRGYEENAHIGSFAGFAPVDNPKFVMLVRIDHPRDTEWAESSAAPLFGEIAEYILNHYEVPKKRK